MPEMARFVPFRHWQQILDSNAFSWFFECLWFVQILTAAQLFPLELGNNANADPPLRA